MNRSLSVLLPVHNAQATLGSDVGRMLDLLPELTHKFDVLIIDDGSTDATSEVAHELARQFPQVRYHRHARRRGVDAALREGLTRTESHVVLGHNGQPRIDIAEITRLWHRGGPIARPADAVDTRAEESFYAKTTGRWSPKWGSVPKVAGADITSFQLLRRDAGETVASIRSMRQIERPSANATATSQPSGSARRPNFLSRLKDFALGE